MPLAIVADIDGEQDTHLALFSKEIKGDPNHLGFLSWTGTSTLDVLKWSNETGVDLAGRRQLFQTLFKMPEVLVPNLDAKIGLEVAELVVDDQPSELKFSLANRRDSVDLESVRVVLSLPSAMSFGEEIDSGNRLDDRRVELNVDTIDCGGTYEAVLPVRALAQGSVSIPPASISFRYRRTESSETPDADGSEETGSISLQTIDHNAEDPLCPIVNVHRSIIPADGNEEIRIGDRFQFELTLKNVGLGRANEIETLVLVPDGLEVLDGSEKVRVNLVPGGERSFRWSIRARRPGIYHIRICDVIYQDLAGRRHATECSEEFRFLVKSDKSREFRYAVQDVVADLSVTETEEEQLAGLLAGLEKAIPDADARSMLRQTAEIDAVLDIVRAAVNGVSKSKSVPIIEQVFRETKWQGKRHKDRGQRKILAFNSGEIPFFAVDYTDSTRGELFMHSFDVPGGDREPFMKADESHSVFASNRMTKGTLDVCLPWADIRTDEKIGIGFIKGWIGRCINRLERDFKPWSEVSACFAEALGGKPMYRWYRYEISVPEPVQNDLAIRDIITPGGSYQCCGWVFRTPGKKDTFTLILNTRREVGSSCKEGSKWLRDRHEDGEHLDVNFYKPLPRTPGEAELTTRDSTWIGTEVKWSSSEAEDAVRAAADKLVDVSHQMYARAASDCDAATHYKTTVPIFVRENGEPNWLDRRIPELTKARIGIRVAWRQEQQIRGSLEFFRRRSKPGAASRYSALGRIRSGGGDGELWMNWYEGMPEDLAIGNRLELDDSFWGEVEKVPKAIRLNLLLRTPPGPVDKELFDLWIDGIIAAATARDQQAWPAFALDEILDRIFATEPRLPGIIESLADGPVSQAELRESAGAEGKKLHSAIGRILKWGTRYHAPSPLIPAHEMPDGIDINPDYRDALLARVR
ncbi:MAG TPA: hypothetical protein DCX60_00805 [Phycisphaerales bacterium]|nr:hypothetical protein [Phycisphaerales bacterium]